MSDLITNLNQIYQTKLQIKEVIGTTSDVFSDYPSYILDAISGSVSGTYNILENGNYNVSSYAYAYVDVSAEIPAGYTYVSGTYNVIGNGTYSVASYESVSVNVPVPSGYVLPTGTYNITNNGTFDVSSYQNAYVSVSGGGGQSLSGTYYDIRCASTMVGTSTGESFSFSTDIAAGEYPAYVVSQLWVEPNTTPFVDVLPTGEYWVTKMYTYTSSGKGSLIATGEHVTEPYWGMVGYNFVNPLEGLALAFYAESWIWEDDMENPGMGMGQYVYNGEVPMFVNDGFSTYNFIIVPEGYGAGEYNFYFFPKNKNNILGEGQIAVINHTDRSDAFMGSLE